MRYLLIALLLASCSSIKETIDKFKTPQESAEEKQARETKERLQFVLDHKNLKNTIGIRIGQTQEQVHNILLDPDSVSGSEGEVVWHYSLYEHAYVNINSPFTQRTPFRIIFKNNAVSKFGIDQDQMERNRANVIIQKDGADLKKD